MKIISLKELATVTAGQSAPKPELFSNEGLPFVRAGSLEELIAGKKESDLELISNDVAKKLRLNLYPAGSILFAKSGISATKNRFYQLKTPAYVVSHLAILIPKDCDFADYFRHVLIKYPPSSLIKDLAYPAISLGDIQDFKVPIPETSDDQIRIATLLSKVENLIFRRREQLKQLDELLKSVFLEMFGDPVRNEKGWKMKNLGDISDIQGGLQVSIKRAANPIELPYLRVANVYRDFLDLREIKTIKVTEAESKRASLVKGDILVVEGHGNPTEIGRSAVWDGSIENCLHQNHLIRVRPLPKYALSVFVSFYINSPIGRKQMFKAGKTTSGLNTISSKNVKETKIVLPPLDLQNCFVGIVSKVEILKAHFSKSLTDLEKLYGALSQKAFKGELDLLRVQFVEKG